MKITVEYLSKTPHIIKVFFLAISLFPATCYSDILGDRIFTQSILDAEQPQPTDFIYFVGRTTWSRNLKRLVVEYQMFVRPEHIDKLKHPFLFYRVCSKLDEFWLYGLTDPLSISSRIWQKYNPELAPPLPYAPYNTPEIVNAGPADAVFGPGKFVSSYYMTTGDPVDLSALAAQSSNDCGELFAGYGLGEKPQDAFNEMFDQKRLEMVFNTNFGIQALGGYLLEVKTIGYSSFQRPIRLPLCPSHPDDDIGCSDF